MHVDLQGLDNLRVPLCNHCITDSLHFSLCYCFLCEERKSALLNSALVSSSLDYFQEKFFQIIICHPSRSFSVSTELHKYNG